MNISLSHIASELGIRLSSIEKTLELLNDGATVPFIARYRKEATGNLDETQITAVRDTAARLQELEKRRSYIMSVIEEQGRLTPELEKQIRAAHRLAELEDIYLPFKPKRRTRGQIARENGLEDLALQILSQNGKNPRHLAEKFLNAEKSVPDIESALKGASDIIAEVISDDPALRGELRRLFTQKGVVSSQVVKKYASSQEAQVYRDYFDHREQLGRMPGHRFLAMLRAVDGGIVRMKIEPPDDMGPEAVHRRYLKSGASRGERELITAAGSDAYQRLIQPSLENEMRKTRKEEADEEAIGVFTENLRQLLLAPPLGEARVLGVDPGLRTGCKLAVLDSSGNLLSHHVIYPLPPRQDTQVAEQLLRKLVKEQDIQAIAVGNGTGGRETLSFITSLDLFRDSGGRVTVTMVNESGASVYSASSLAREEFPDLDLTVRGAVSIGRRLMDPLAELIKIDPRSIGVGQYQHDVDQKRLQQGLDDTVVSCVNAVGVELNTASPRLLSYVSGMNPGLSKAVVEQRSKLGKFRSRKDLQSVSGLGPKTFEQAAGFLRIHDGDHPLDKTAVHPERYPLVEQMAGDLGVKLQELPGNTELIAQIDARKYLGPELNSASFSDIIAELKKPGRDPRKSFQAFQFAEGVEKIDDLNEGMKLPGVVTNITKFGAFVDIGVHQDGLIHISEMADRFVSDPGEVLALGQQVTVRVISVDAPRKRIGLSLKNT
ncbi:Tex family protein [Salinispira pacifica]|uniref:Transcription accessory protein (S1 RNA-binding domain) n=1 Tax=Salinispira pacifica TaxID=1307761 RepID=V5WJP5_9SPIO|nr:Tex family protein [Salinispira pacifica]AHC15799.1 Transcription accessory protein (S1 RNA-binding domain) [Salinispira pacifica]